MQIEEAIRLARNIKWRSVEKDNMEYEARVTTYQVEAVNYLAELVEREYM